MRGESGDGRGGTETKRGEAIQGGVEPGKDIGS